jgi:hypothetical protein
MPSKLCLGLIAALGFPALLASALGQQSGENRPSGASVSSSSSASAGDDNYSTQRSGTVSVGGGNSSDARSDQPSQGESARFFFSPDGSQRGGYVTTYVNDQGLAWPTGDQANLEHEVTELAGKLSSAKSDSDRSKIRTQIGEILDKQFDLRQKHHVKEIEALEAKVKKLKELVQKRQDNRREIVSKRLDQILSDAEGLGW